MSTSVRGSRLLVGVLSIACIGGFATGCDEASSTPRPSSSLLEIDFTPRPTATASSDEPTPDPTFIAIPVGWDTAFCAIFADVQVAQELVNDVQRALDEEAIRDARGLARELRDITTDAAALMAELPDWDPAQDATAEITAMIDLGGRAGTEYGDYFTTEERGALRRARNLRRDIANNTPATNEKLAELGDLGISCEGVELRLEEF
jgi:hypothetical protein